MGVWLGCSRKRKTSASGKLENSNVIYLVYKNKYAQ